MKTKKEQAIEKIMSPIEEVTKLGFKVNLFDKKDKNEFKKDLRKLYDQAYADALDDVLKIVQDWKDVSIKDNKIALMITNGGYIHKPSFEKRLAELGK